MARAPKLKVYCMPAGFYDAVVAASSQKAALRAWGTTTDLFAAGRASIVEDERLQAEALARPGEVIKRPRGDAAAMLGPEPEETPRPGPARKPAPARRPAPPPDPSKLEAAERALAEARQDLEAELQALAERRADLDRREAEIRSRGEDRLSALEEARQAAETAYRRAVERARV